MKKNFVFGLLAGLATSLLLILLALAGVNILLKSYAKNPGGNGTNVGYPLPTPTKVAGATATPTPTPNYNIGDDLLSKEFLRKLQLLADIIDQYYYQDVEVSQIQDGLLYAIMDAIGDPYTIYYSRDEYDSFMESSNGVYCGIGSQVSQNMETMEITIVKPFVNGPAYKAGLKAGDKILAIDGEDVRNTELTFVVAKMKGEKDTQVVVTVYRESTGETLDITITRDQIEVPTVEYEMKDNRIGYIAVSGFEAVTAKQFEAAYDALEAQGMTGLVIDLRDNPGGLLSVCVEMVDYMLPDGQLITYTLNKQGKGDTFKSQDGHECQVPVVILTNEYSASASEVFTGALKDNGVAISMGTTSFGKGIVQSLLPLTDGTAVKLTTSSYYTPSGVCIHGIGIKPDVEVLPDSEYDNQLEEAIKHLNKSR